jgi:hypothetical protein
MKKFEKAEIELIKFAAMDVITTSGEPEGEENELPRD